MEKTLEVFKVIAVAVGSVVIVFFVLALVIGAIAFVHYILVADKESGEILDAKDDNHMPPTQ